MKWISGMTTGWALAAALLLLPTAARGPAGDGGRLSRSPL